MLVLNFMYMKKNLFRFSSRRFLFSTVMASALVTGAPQAVFAYVGEVGSNFDPKITTVPMWEKYRLFRRLGQSKVKSWIPMENLLLVPMSR